VQVYYQIIYRLNKPQRIINSWEGTFVQIPLVDFPDKNISLWINDESWCFSFLNIEKSFFEDSLDWSFGDYGMLWAYNLNYFDWLHQPDLSKEQGIDTLNRFYSTPAEKNPIILHPYPTSLRIINTAKFVSKWAIREGWLYSELVSDLKFLSSRLEFHLQANHLLENAFALYIGGIITNQKEIKRKGKKLLIRELEEQILSDGMHYERSPMYHLIILERLLDSLNFAMAIGDDLKSVLKSYAIKMTGFAMNWKNLDRIPMMQDSAYGVALTVPEILKYSKMILSEDYPSSSNNMKDSGYRNLISGSFSLFANVGSIGPSYQPGHAHSDELSFELFYNGAPIIVDTGVSTYEKNNRRQKERSTNSHNCIVLGNNSSDVWSGFRVGRRANVKIGLDDKKKVTATHDGFSILTSRSFDSSVSSVIIIKDQLNHQSNSSGNYGIGFLHLHPDVYLIQKKEGTFLINNQLELIFQSEDNTSSIIGIDQYCYAKGYNILQEATVITYSVFNQITIQIREAN